MRVRVIRMVVAVHLIINSARVTPDVHGWARRVCAVVTHGPGVRPPRATAIRGPVSGIGIMNRIGQRINLYLNCVNTQCVNQ